MTTPQVSFVSTGSMTKAARPIWRIAVLRSHLGPRETWAASPPSPTAETPWTVAASTNDSVCFAAAKALSPPLATAATATTVSVARSAKSDDEAVSAVVYVRKVSTDGPMVLASHCASSDIGRSLTSVVKLEFFFDATSPWTYLAYSRIRDVAAKTGANLIVKPILVGGVFNVANRELYAARDKLMAGMLEGADDGSCNSKPPERSAKDRYADHDLLEWADYMGLDIKTMGERLRARTRSGGPGHPIRAVELMRGAVVAQENSEETLDRYAFACFDAYWGRLEDISDPCVLKQLCVRGGLPMAPDAFLKRIADQDVKDRLAINTRELVARGGFGSPTMFVSADGVIERMFFGNDRMPLVEAAVLRASGRPWRYQETL
eukprot:TRINITY_DN44769_c0_g1_i1.p1 TRINITY_DN44769_c0_g1~~TRINITY_DN44769_c0_g1_i1.p1  ORF type:complete len:377 (-),score=56.82 TRINITY_DN44769_c0_g1_i1:76-1206(-)